MVGFIMLYKSVTHTGNILGFFNFFVKIGIWYQYLPLMLVVI